MSDGPCSGDPVSWLLVEAGWRVVGRDGEALGKVEDVLGDANVDIFDGLAVTPGLLGATRAVPAERVARITEGCVELDLGAEEFDALAEHVENSPVRELGS